MSRRIPRVNPLQLRKELLVAESDLNRAQLSGDWQALTAGVRSLTAQMKSISALASAAALLVAGIAAFRRERALARNAKSSWLGTLLKGAKVASSIWMAFRAPGPDRTR